MNLFLDKFQGHLRKYPEGYFREGYRPVPEGVSSFLFLTRRSDEARVQEAFLSFDREGAVEIEACSKWGVSYRVERIALTPSLRTPVGLRTMDVTKAGDYLAHQPYRELRRVKSACGFIKVLDWPAFWNNLQRELDATRIQVVTVRRINPYSPNTHLVAFVSKTPFSPSK